MKIRKNKITLAYIKNKSLLKVFVIILPVYLIGCQNNVGNNSGSNSGNNSSRLNRYKTTDDTPSSYQGSQAYNSSLLTNEEVNGQTGTLTLSKPLIVASGITKDIDLNFNLMYASSSSKLKSILGLPKGWSYQISYVIPNKSANIDGRNFIIDDNYNSGLRYVNNHAIKFSSYYDSKQLTCNKDKRSYNYDYRGAQGEHLYFDEAGKLIAKANRFGSCISYYYSDNGSDDIYHSYLDHIVDSYGKTYKFATDVLSGTVTVTDTLAKTIASFSYNDAGVGSYSDAMGYKTNYNYYDNNGLLNSITYPSGLVTNVDYIDIPYSICGGQGQVGYLKAVGEITHQGNNNKVLNKTDYDYNAGSANFTGYQAGGGKCMSPDTDNLADSLDLGFNYSVVITKKGDNSNPDQISSTTYNFIHLPIKQQTLSSSKAILSETDFKYNISSSPSTRSGSYSSPIEIKSIKGGNTVAVENKSYDDYNQETSSQQSVSIKGQLKPYKNVTTNYFPEPAFYLVKDSSETDMLTKKVLSTTNELTTDGLNLQTSNIKYNNNSWKSLNYSYDPQGRITNEAIAWLDHNHDGIKNTSTSYSYDYNSSNGILTVAKHGFDGGVTKTTAYDTTLPGSPLISEISPLGKATKHSYDLDGRDLSVTSAGGFVTSTSYKVARKDGNNQIIKTDPLNHIVTINYDELARPVLITDNGGNNGSNRTIQQNYYNQLGEVDSTTDELGRTTTYAYDELGRQKQATDSLNNIFTTNYDDAKLTITTSLNGLPYTKEIQDGRGNKLEVIKYSSDNHFIAALNSYNGFDQQVESVVNSDGNELSTNMVKYDGDGDITKTTHNVYDKNSIEEVTNNDLLGKPSKLTATINQTPLSNNYSNTYDKLGQLKSSVNSLGTKTMDYDLDGNLAHVTSYDGNTDYTYDENNNVKTVTINKVTLSKSYDGMHNLLSITQGDKDNSTINYAYTNTSLLSKVTYPDGKVIAYTYYDNGLLKTKTNAFGVVTSYQYDNNGRIKSIITLDSSLSYGYADKNLNAGKKGRLKTVTLINKAGQVLKHNYSYDGWGNIASDKITQGTNQSVVTYTRDSLQRLAAENITSTLNSSSLNMDKTFKYDGLNHLLSSKAIYKGNSDLTVNESYSYDQDGNVTDYTNNESTTHYTYKNDQLIAVNGQPITYDAAGNMKNDPDGNTYTYNSLNQLTKVSNNNTPITSYDYYADGLLSSKLANNNTLSFYYDNGHADGITSKDISGKEDSTSFMLSSDGSIIATYKGNVSNYYLSAGNSTVGMLGESGNLTNSYKYQGYGSVTSDKTPDPAQSFLWNGEYTDNDTGLVYLRARFYNPKLMRFMNADTVNVPNLYNFGDGDPINKTDPSGHSPAWINYALDGVAILGAIAACGYFRRSSCSSVRSCLCWRICSDSNRRWICYSSCCKWWKRDSFWSNRYFSSGIRK